MPDVLFVGPVPYVFEMWRPHYPDLYRQAAGRELAAECRGCKREFEEDPPHDIGRFGKILLVRDILFVWWPSLFQFGARFARSANGAESANDLA